MRLEDFNEEQRAFITSQVEAAKSIDVESATKFLKNAGAKIFLSEKSYQDHVENQLSDLENGKPDNPSKIQAWVQSYLDRKKGKTLSMFDQKVLKDELGIEREDGEQTIEAIIRGIKSVKGSKGEGISEAEFNALKIKLEEANVGLKEWEDKYNGLNNTMLDNEKNGFIKQGMITDSWDYDDFVKKAIAKDVENEVNSKYEFQKDDRGWFGIDKATGNPVLTPNGERLHPTDITKNYLSTKENIKIKEGYTSTNGVGEMSAEAKKRSMEQFNEEANKQGLLSHEKAYYTLAKDFKVIDEVAGENKAQIEKLGWI